MENAAGEGFKRWLDNTKIGGASLRQIIGFSWQVQSNEPTFLPNVVNDIFQAGSYVWHSGDNNPGNLEGHAGGGFVGGPEGTPRLILAHGGELVLNRRQQEQGVAGAGGGNTIYITVNEASDAHETARVVTERLMSALVP